MWYDIKAFLIEQGDALWKGITSLGNVWAVICAAGLVILSFLDRQVGGMTPQMVLLAKLQIVGFALGTLAAFLGKGKHHATFRSDVGIRGVEKKAAMWAWIWLMHVVDLSLGLTGTGIIGGVVSIRNTLVIAYNLYEAASIAETYVNLGWYGHKAVERMLVWRIDRLKEWAVNKLGGGVPAAPVIPATEIAPAAQAVPPEVAVSKGEST